MTGTIAWPQALATAQRLVAHPGRSAEAVETVLAKAPVFQNRDFPLSPMPVLVREEAARALRSPLEEYVTLLGDVVRHYREQPEVRAWYGLPADADRLIAADPGPGDAPWVCRLDCYLEQATERLVLLENNADAPAGTLFTSRINDVVEQVTALVAPDSVAEPSALTYRGRDRFLDALLDASRAAAARVPGKSATPQRVAVLQPRGAANRESVEMVEEFGSRGLEVFLADPRDLRVTGGRATFGSRTADLCWNKVNTVAWNAMTADADLVATWERALRDTPMVHVNPFGSRYVAENKLSLAFVQEPRFAHLFSDAQRQLVADLLPWTRRVAEQTPGVDGRTSLLADLLERQGSFVLKEAYDIRGDGVTVGHDVPRGAWRDAVRRAAAGGHIAQSRVRPLQYPVVTAGSDRVDPMSISLDAYLLGGALAGFGSKASHNAKINIFQGGQKLAVHVTSGESW
ncbi:hypothetical protein [Streptantibioticus silvisoli]|uniref:Circularly permuted type 2 ATP-grasp protein n=1 Tax=Streptantibioticus silvisoli TaxID=2705255 RepID=A0ABT6W3I1_9ACTN|nr:hypothetical protein [Streptantibioticus silvisoli]MDI5964532.1 hypothetical protein [Streptantibioticus silvisoli]